MLSVKMHQTEATSCNQTKSGDDAAEKFVSNDARNATTETTQLLENVLEHLSKSSLICETLKNQASDAKEGASSQRGNSQGAQQGEQEGQRQVD